MGAIIINNGITYRKHQEIAYKQYIAEDLRQARIYNSTFANNEKEFNEKIKDFPEADKVIAKALYEAKPEIDKIKQELKDNNSTKKNLTEELSTKHDILHDSKLEALSSIEEYLEKYNITGEISGDEYEYLHELFCPKTTDTNKSFLNEKEFAEAIAKHNISVTYSDDYKDYTNLSRELTEVEFKISQEQGKLNSIKQEYNNIINENSPTLEYQDTITTNGIKSAIDYMTTI